ncbi:MAG: RNA-binding S4 domain-containing protein [Acidiferrobacterales bacterium]|nr:RNA-binding S4 domain-containing protein [Acidiferrobacterales bacterium]
MRVEFVLEGEHIELYKLLKVEGIAATGGEAKGMIANGIVTVNDEVELRKRNKIRVGDVIKTEDTVINIIGR